MTSPTDQYVLLRAFVDELVRCGMSYACTSPGSRSAPLVLSLTGDPRLTCHSHIDERAAGFFALGLAKATGMPVAVACTSGTAAAELLPAVVEAHEARVPLVVLTADRPPELREVGAGQAIDQIKLYGAAAKWFFEVGNHEATPARVRWMRALACRAYATSVGGRPGVVHLNFPLREPLVVEGPLPGDETGRPGGAPYVHRIAPALDASAAARELATLVSGARRGVLVAGRHERHPPLGPAADACARIAGWPLLADPLSGARRGPAAIAHYDALLRDPAFAGAHRPDLVVRVGDLPTSKPLRSWLAALDGVTQVTIDGEEAVQDPDGVVSHLVAADPAATLQALGSALAPAANALPPERGWLDSWCVADHLAAEAIDDQLRRAGLSEPLVAAHLGRTLPADATLFVAASMPVRDVETFWPAREDPPRVLSNRGANGIDGTVSSAFGVAAAASAGAPVVLLIGDVALAHDLGGLLVGQRLGCRLTIIALDNGGGGIFDYLPVAQAPMARAGDAYERHIATPPQLSLAHAAELCGATHVRIADVAALPGALDAAIEAAQTTLLEVGTDRAASVALHRGVWAAVADAIRAAS